MISNADTTDDRPYKKFMFETDFDELPEDKTITPLRQLTSDEEGGAMEPGEAREEASLDAEAVEPEPEPEPEPTYSEEDFNRAREQGLAEGRQQGIEEAAHATDRQIAEALEALVGQADALFKAQAAANLGVTTDAVQVAAALVRKLFPTLNEQAALDQIEAMLRKALDQLGGVPEIKVRVPGDLAEAVHDRIEALATVSGLQGDLKVVGEADMEIGDCRLEWNRGGVTRSTQELARELDDIVERNLLGAGAPAPDAPSPQDESAPATTDIDPASAAETETPETQAGPDVTTEPARDVPPEFTARAEATDGPANAGDAIEPTAPPTPPEQSAPMVEVGGAPDQASDSEPES